MQIRSAVRYRFTPTRMTNFKGRKWVLEQTWRNRSPWACKMVQLRRQLAVRLAAWPGTPAPGCTPKKLKTCSNKSLHTEIFTSIVTTERWRRPKCPPSWTLRTYKGRHPARGKRSAHARYNSDEPPGTALSGRRQTGEPARWMRCLRLTNAWKRQMCDQTLWDNGICMLDE